MKDYLSKDGRIVTIKEAVESDAQAIEAIVNSVASEWQYVVPDRSCDDWDETIRDVKNRKSLLI